MGTERKKDKGARARRIALVRFDGLAHAHGRPFLLLGDASVPQVGIDGHAVEAAHAVEVEVRATHRARRLRDAAHVGRNARDALEAEDMAALVQLGGLDRRRDLALAAHV